MLQEIIPFITCDNGNRITDFRRNAYTLNVKNEILLSHIGQTYSRGWAGDYSGV